MMQKKAVTVLVACFNEEKHIARCLRSLCNQSLDHSLFDILVVDDGSIDSSVETARAFSDLKVLVSEKNEGLPSALNAGLSVIETDWVVRVDADDYVSREFLSGLLQKLAENPNVDGVVCDYQMVSEDETILAVKNWLENPLGCAFMFRLEDARALGGYNAKFKINEDQEFFNRFITNRRIVRLAEPLYRYRQHDGNMTGDLAKKAYYDRLIENLNVR